MKREQNQGFSLIELIIVIAIMAVLVAVIAPNLTSYVGKSKKNTDVNNADTMEDVISNAIPDFIGDADMRFEKKGEADESATISAADTYLVNVAGGSKIMSMNTFIAKCAGADDNTFLNNVYNSLEKYVDANKEINPKILTDAYYIRFAGSYMEGYSCDVILYDKTKIPTDTDFE